MTGEDAGIPVDDVVIDQPVIDACRMHPATLPSREVEVNVIDAPPARRDRRHSARGDVHHRTTDTRPLQGHPGNPKTAAGRVLNAGVEQELIVPTGPGNDGVPDALPQNEDVLIDPADM